MGIKNLLPTLNGIQKNIHIKKYAGKKVAVDGHVWLHSAAYSCATDLALNLPTEKYVGFFKSRIEMMRHFKVEPIIVFDGQRLPQKDHITKQRETKRQQSIKNGLAYLEVGEVKAAEKCFREAIKITSDMIYTTIQFLDTIKVQHIIAPYEADPQLTYLLKSGQVNAVITVDSDLLTFGCSNVVFKMDKGGNAVEVNYADICPYLTRHPTNSKKLFVKRSPWNPDMFRYMCIMAGCDYLEPLPQYTIAKARKFVEHHPTPQVILEYVKNSYSRATFEQYEANFYKADAAYKYQFVFDPNTRTYCRLYPLPTNDVNFQMDDISKLGDSPQNQDIPLLQSNRAVHLDFDIIRRNANKENIDPNGVYRTSSRAKPTGNACQQNVNTALIDCVHRNMQKPLSTVHVNQLKSDTRSSSVKDTKKMKVNSSMIVNQRQVISNSNMKQLSLTNAKQQKSVTDTKKNTLYTKNSFNSSNNTNNKPSLSLSKHQQRLNLNSTKKSVKFVDENSSSSSSSTEMPLTSDMKASSSISRSKQATTFHPYHKPSSSKSIHILNLYEELEEIPNCQPNPRRNQADKFLSVDPKETMTDTQEIPIMEKLLPFSPAQSIIDDLSPVFDEVIDQKELKKFAETKNTTKNPIPQLQTSMTSSQTSSQIPAFDDDINEEDLVHLADEIEAKLTSPLMSPLIPMEILENSTSAPLSPQQQSSSSQIPSLDDDLDSQLFHLAEQVEAEVMPITSNITVAMPNNLEIPLQITTCKMDTSIYKINGVNYNPKCTTSSKPPTTHLNHHMPVHDVAHLITKCMTGDQRATKTREYQLQEEDEARKNMITENMVWSKEAKQNVRSHMTVKDVSWRIQPPASYSRKRKAEQELLPSPNCRQQRNRRV